VWCAHVGKRGMNGCLGSIRRRPILLVGTSFEAGWR
jgi:hypothetical protein